MFDSKIPDPPCPAHTRRLAWACGLSLFLHALVVAAPRIKPAPRLDASPPPLAVTLPEPPPLHGPPPQPTLLVPAEDPVPAAKIPIPRRAQVPGGKPVNVAALASRQVSRHLFYPPEAVARGLEGEALVMLFLDESGTAIAARLERSSGHGLLDEAALAAARAIRTLPAGGSQEVLLPVRFRLR